MPCTDGGTWYDNYEEIRIQKELDKIKGLLCEACRVIKDPNKMSSTLKTWWLAHQEEDRIRQAEIEEQLKLKKLAASARSKLTTEELEALRFEM